MTGLVVIVGEAACDPLVGVLAPELRWRGFDVRLVKPGDLASGILTMRANEANWSGAPITAAIFRASTEVSFADSFCQDDRSFATCEVLAAWLHLLSIPSVRCVNRGDPETWFALADWPVWRRRFAVAGVPLAPLVLGDAVARPTGRWVHWGGGDTASPSESITRRVFLTAVVPSFGVHRSVWCCGRVVIGPRSRPVNAAGRVLESGGVLIGGIDTDDEGCVVAATSRPTLTRESAEPAAWALADFLAA